MGTPAWGINYFRCDTTKNCAKVYGGCGRYDSVHRRYKELYEAKAREGDKVSNCLAPTERDKRIKHQGIPVCKNQRCGLKLPPKESTEENQKAA